MKMQLQPFFAGDPIPRTGKQVTIRGKTYQSLSHAARDLGVSRSVVSQAFKEGRLARVGTGVNITPCKVLGKSYPSIAEAARQLGVSPKSISRMIDLGIENLLEPGKRHQPALARATPIEWNGTHYPSIRAAAHALGINYSTFLDQVRARDHHEAPALRQQLLEARAEIARLQQQVKDLTS